MSPERVTLQMVRESLNPNIRAHYSVKWFGRPIGNLWTPWFYNTGWTADAVTVWRMAVAAVAVMMLIVPWALGPPLAAILFYVCFILDCVDGNLARLRTSVTYWGKFIDGLSDFVFVQGAPFGAGLGIWLAGCSAGWMAAGALVTVMTLTHQMVRSRLSFFREWMVSLTGPLTEADHERTHIPRKWQEHAANVYVNGSFLSPLLLFWPLDGVQWFVVSMLMTVGMAEAVWLCATVVEAKAILMRGRRSIHSPPEQAA